LTKLQYVSANVADVHILSFDLLEILGYAKKKCVLASYRPNVGYRLIHFTSRPTIRCRYYNSL